MLRKLIALLAMAIVVVIPASASMAVNEFKKLTTEQQSIYIGAAVNMLAYTYAADGNPTKGRCISRWYYGEPGKEAPGPRAVRIEIGVAEERGPEKFQIEGLILGLTDKICGPSVSAPPLRK